MGYHRAGFEVVGVDINPQPHYPFEFHQADALTFPLDGFDAIHASPPCQFYSVLTPSQVSQAEHRAKHADLIPATPIRLCGSSFLLPIQRHRYFEVPWLPFSLLPVCRHPRISVVPSGHTNHRINGARAPGNKVDEIRLAMDIDWMTGDELSQAIPPAYTEWIGRQLLAAIERAA